MPPQYLIPLKFLDDIIYLVQRQCTNNFLTNVVDPEVGEVSSPFILIAQEFSYICCKDARMLFVHILCIWFVKTTDLYL